MKIIPAIEELKQHDKWVCWNYELRMDKTTKIPKTIRGGNADSKDPSTWASCTAAKEARKKFRYAGVGFVFDSTGYAGVDLDDCLNEQCEIIKPEAAAILGRLNSYSEISPSGKGIKVFVRGSVPKGFNWNGVEMYSDGRYFTVTGRHMPGTPDTINDCSNELSTLYDELVAIRDRERKPATQRVNTPIVRPLSGTGLTLRQLVTDALGQPAMEIGNRPYWYCPFHHDIDPPDFHIQVFDGKEFYGCWMCDDVHGDDVSWLVQYHGLTMREAMQRQRGDLPGYQAEQVVDDLDAIRPPLLPEQKAQITFIFQKTLRRYHDEMTAGQRQQWQDVGIPDGVVDMLDLGYADKEVDQDTGEILRPSSLVVPLRNIEGEATNFEYRYDSGGFSYEGAAMGLYYPEPPTVDAPLLIMDDSLTTVTTWLAFGHKYQIGGLPHMAINSALVPELDGRPAYVLLEPGTGTGGRGLRSLSEKGVRFLRLPMTVSKMIQHGANENTIASYLKYAKTIA